MSEFELTCSCCGAHSRHLKRSLNYAVELADEGWRNYGTAMYCPSCSETWSERNPGRNLSSYPITVTAIMQEMLHDAEDEIKRLKHKKEDY